MRVDSRARRRCGAEGRRRQVPRGRERGQVPWGRGRAARHLRLLKPSDESKDEDEARDGAADDRVEGDREESEPGIRRADVQRGDDADGDR